MPIPISDVLVPGGSGFAVAEDAHIKGSYRSVANVAARDSIPASRRKVGMRVFLEDTEAIYTLAADLTTWEPQPELLTTPQTLTVAQQVTVRRNADLAASDTVAGMPALASRGGDMNGGGSITPVAGTGWGMNGAVGADTRIGFWNKGNQGRIVNSGIVRKVRFFVPATLPANCEIEILWLRLSFGRWYLIGRTGNLRSLVTNNDTVQTVTLPNPVPVQIGDHIAGELRYTSGSWGAGFHAVATPSTYLEWTAQDLAWGYSLTWESGADFSAMAGTSALTIPIECIMDPPVLCLTGDSRPAGVPDGRALFTPTQQWDKENDIAWLMEKATGWSCRQVGIEGNTTAQMAARFATDVLACNPLAVGIFPGAFNDIYAGFTANQHRDNVQTMIDAALAAGCYVFVCSDWPFKDPAYAYEFPTDIQNVASDEMSLAIEALVRTYDPARVTWIDLRPDMGVERPQPTPIPDPNYWKAGNLWDLNELYWAATDDRLHMSPAGKFQTAATVATGLRSFFKRDAAVPRLISLTAAENAAQTRPAGTLVYLGDTKEVMRHDGVSSDGVRLAENPAWITVSDDNYSLTATRRTITYVLFDVPLTADRTLSVDPTGFRSGDIVRVVRRGLGPFSLFVDTYTTIPPGAGATVELTFQSGDFILTAMHQHALARQNVIADDKSPTWGWYSANPVILDDDDFGYTALATGEDGLARPAVFVVSGIPGLKRYVMVVSPDHDHADGEMFALHADAPTGPWTLLNDGDPILTGGQEFPQLFQHGNTLYLFTHDDVAGIQKAYYSTSTDGHTWSAPALAAVPHSNDGRFHTSYFYVWYDADNGLWRGWSVYPQASNYWFGASWTATSPNGPWTYEEGQDTWNWNYHLTQDLTLKTGKGTPLSTFSRGNVLHAVTYHSTWNAGPSGRTWFQGRLMHPTTRRRALYGTARQFVSVGGAGAWNEQAVECGSVIRADDGRLYAFVRGVSAAGKCSIGVAVADETTEATASTGIPTTPAPFEILDQAGVIHIGEQSAEYKLSAGDFGEVPAYAANGSFAASGSDWLITNIGDAGGLAYALLGDTDIDLSTAKEVEFRMELANIPYTHTNIYMSIRFDDIYATGGDGVTINKGCAFGYLETAAAADGTMELRGFTASPGFTQWELTGFGPGTDAVYVNDWRRTTYSLILRPPTLDLAIILDNDQPLFTKRAAVGEMVATGLVRPRIVWSARTAGTKTLTVRDLIVRVRT
jgi:hypothetical protein